uniref:Uncharacterized protein n=1 Tax=Oryza glumipatula TaxID=40148 RepID=A0A0E0AW97_9ORYZ
MAMSSISGRRPAACMSWRRCPASFGSEFRLCLEGWWREFRHLLATARASPWLGAGGGALAMPSCERSGRRSGGGVRARRPAKRSGAVAASGRARGGRRSRVERRRPRVTLPASAGVVATRATFSTHSANPAEPLDQRRRHITTRIDRSGPPP